MKLLGFAVVFLSAMSASALECKSIGQFLFVQKTANGSAWIEMASHDSKGYYLTFNASCALDKVRKLEKCEGKTLYGNAVTLQILSGYGEVVAFAVETGKSESKVRDLYFRPSECKL